MVFLAENGWSVFNEKFLLGKCDLIISNVSCGLLLEKSCPCLF